MTAPDWPTSGTRRPVPVTLTDDQVARAESAGACRHHIAVSRGGQRKGGQPAEDNLDDHMDGATAECAVAQALGIPWRPPRDEDRHDGDLPGRIEVRSTRYVTGHLIIKQGDPPDRPYVLVTGRRPNLVVQGWMMGRDAMQSDYWRDDIRAPAWLVPQDALHPMPATNGGPVTEGQPTLQVQDDQGSQDSLFSVSDIPAEIRSLVDRYKLPPFTVLDRRQGYWQKQSQTWKDLGIESELGRQDSAVGAFATIATFAESGTYGKDTLKTKVSIFDPALCEVAYHWWCPPGGVVLDPFAGGSVRGIVAGMMGYQYIGIDLNADQVDANRRQADRIFAVQSGKPCPLWMAGDARKVLADEGIGPVDFVFTCPPYGDLEVYSDDPADLSNMDATAFADAYADIIARAVGHLAPDRFAAIVVGNYRAKDGTLRDLAGLTVRAFKGADARYYNEAIIVDPVGTMAVRAKHQFSAQRKLVRGHQYLLGFVKGDQRAASAACMTEYERQDALADDEKGAQ